MSESDRHPERRSASGSVRPDEPKDRKQITGKTNVPRLALWLLRTVARPDDYYFALGDLNQIYASILRDKSPLAAHFWIWWEILRSLPGFAKNTIYWSTVMLKNYLKITWRNALRQPGYSLITITGLAVGIACSLLILLWVQHELTFDSMHAKGDRIYRSCIDIEVGTRLRAPASSPPMGPAMVEDFPEVLATVSFRGISKAAITIDGKEFFVDDVTMTSESLFEVFDFPLLLGDPATALEAPFSAVISESTTKKFFGAANPIGRTFRFEDGHDYTITGVFKDIPSNSHLRFNIARSLATMNVTDPEFLQGWWDFGQVTYLLLDEGADYRALEAKMDDYVMRHFGDLEGMGLGRMTVYFQPLNEVYLHSDFGRDFGIVGNITYVYGFAAVAIFILMIAGVNFVNLSTARAANRAREVGLRKALGAERNKLIGQFLGEAVVYCLSALMLGMFLIEMALPAFNNLADVDLSLGALARPETILMLLGAGVLIGVLAGAYPAFYLSSFNPSRSLKQVRLSRSSNSNIRNILVVFQFAVSIILIIGTLTIYGQLDYMRNQDLGFDGEQVVVLYNVDNTIKQEFGAFLNEIRNIPGVAAVSSSSRVPGRGVTKSLYWPEGLATDDPQPMNGLVADHNYFETLDIHLAAGRNFSPDQATDSTTAIIINEAAVAMLGWEEPLGRIIRTDTEDSADPEPYPEKRVIGVIKDFHQYSLQNPIEPLAITYSLEPQRAVSIKLATASIADVIQSLERVWKEFSPGRPFDYFFLDEDFAKQYHKEVRLSEIVLYFCVLAVFIGCLGLFGMASFAAEQRTREIGIRKVLGASTTGVVSLLTRQFLTLVAIANILAWPVAYFLMDHWLQNFAYHDELGVGVFAASGLAACATALITVSYQSIRAARTNPVESLKHE